MELAIHILLAGIIVGAAFCLVMMVYIIRELNRLTERMDQKVQTMVQNNIALFNKMRDLEREKREANPFREILLRAVKRAADEANKVNVVDGEKPLDFPNETDETDKH